MTQRLIIVDLECTCWRGNAPTAKETIEIGSVSYALGQSVVGEFQTFVRPKLGPILSPFCMELTHISHEQVDEAPLFPQALNAWTEWAAHFELYVLASWGAFDAKQLRAECRLHGIRYPFGVHLNLKKAFAKAINGKPRGMAKALRYAGLDLQGTHHRGIDDARNIAKTGHLYGRAIPRLVGAARPRDMRRSYFECS